MAKSKVTWKKKPEDHDYDGAQSYLSLIFTDAKAKSLVKALHKAEAISHPAKDLLRAARLPLLERNDPHVDDDLKKIHAGEAIAPVLLVRGDAENGRPLIVADGYHRICAVYYFDENLDVICRMTRDAKL
jgi:hypothetical protein